MEADPFFDWCADNFRETVIVPGNHEYYYDPEDVAGRTGVPVERTLAGYEHRIRDNVRYLNNRSAVFGDVEVFVTTLWTRTDPRYYVTIQSGMNDCRAILYDGHARWVRVCIRRSMWTWSPSSSVTTSPAGCTATLTPSAAAAP